MVKVKEKFPRNKNGNVDVDAWLQKIQTAYTIKNIESFKQACELAAKSSKGLTTFYGQPCLEQGLEMAEILLDLKLDPTSIVTAIIMSSAQHAHLSLDEITQHLDDKVAKLVHNVLQMDVINTLTPTGLARNQIQLDRLRKVLLAMVSDIRAVIIKLAERTAIIRGIKQINPDRRKLIAQETMDIYAPLANRLGIGQLKWELEDLSFHYLDPTTYKTIASFLAEKRTDREERVEQLTTELKNQLAAAHIPAKVSGRAKHIYSIFLKKKRKQIDYHAIFDYSAARILVPTINDCYTALSIVHRLWDQIPEEFDDYIARPKPNGYRSIHTAVIGPQGKNVEIQIRTHEMHEQAEHGVAAHWIYKEDKKQKTDYEDKITYLRQLLAWQRDITEEQRAEKNAAEVFSDRVYVFTPTGDVIDLPVGATPLDFAYHLHSDLGHQCRGAKINGQIIPLLYHLQTGDQVDILTTPQGGPSRDWLNREAGYLKTSRARAKVAQWFRQQETKQYTEAGKQTLERELDRLGIHHVNLGKIANLLEFKTEEALFTALGHGSIRLNQVIQATHAEQKAGEKTPVIPLIKKSPKPSGGLIMSGIDDVLTRIARCCKPIPGDKVIGFITQGRGVSVHRKDCYNVSHLLPGLENRLVDVAWDSKSSGSYYVDIYIQAYGREDSLRNVANLFANFKVAVIALNSTISHKNNMISIMATVQISDSSQLHQLIDHIQQQPFVVEVKRISE